MTVLPPYLLSDNAEVGDDGRLSIAGCDVIELADELGTPLFVYDEAHVRARCREALAAFGDGVSYAGKAFLCKAMARLVHEEGLHIDVASGGEMHVARAAGMPASKVVLHGNNKSLEELRMALAQGVGRIVVDSFDELDRLDELAAAGVAAPEILLRVTPGVEAHTHEFIRTGQDDSKFGFGCASGAAAEAVKRAAAAPSVQLRGIHAHIGSQIFSAASFEKAVEVLAPFVNPLKLPELSIGGGLGVAYVAGEQAPSLAEWGAAIRSACTRAGISARVTAEPGRAIVAQAAVTLYRVGTIKHLPGIRTYVAVDGGMSDNPRPVLYGSGYETFLPRATDSERGRRVTVVGKHCESGDMLVQDGLVPEDLQVGDIICTPVTGAYGLSMGSNYNLVPRPAAVFVADGKVREVVRRETYEDMMRCHV